MNDLRQIALEILAQTDAQFKVNHLLKLFKNFQQQKIHLDSATKIDSENFVLPRRPAKPELVSKRRMDTLSGVWRVFCTHLLTLNLMR